MIRSVLAIIAGYIILSVLAIATALALNTILPGIAKFPPSRLDFALINLTFITLYSVVAGFAVATIARRLPLRHGVIFGIVLLTLGGAFNFFEARGAALWYPLTVAMMECAGAILGGYLKARRIPKQRAATLVSLM